MRKLSKIQKKIDDFLDTLIKISPTRQTLKSERGDFNILREHLQTNRRYVLIGNKPYKHIDKNINCEYIDY